MLYRIHESLCLPDGGTIKKGTLNNLQRLSSKGIRVLLERGSISEVSAPPLTLLPGWEERAEQLREFGIEDVSQLIEADAASLARELGQTEAELQSQVVEARTYIEED